MVCFTGHVTLIRSLSKLEGQNENNAWLSLLFVCVCVALMVGWAGTFSQHYMKE